MKKRYLIAAFIGIVIIAITYKIMFPAEDAQAIARTLLQQAGITINGSNPWDIQVHNDQLYKRVIQQGSLGLGEAYMDGWWDCAALDQFFCKLLEARLADKMPLNTTLLWNIALGKLYNLQSKMRAFEVGEQHYDLDNNLFAKMLDKRMIYSCGYWKNAAQLDKAQEDKLDLICKKLMLSPGMTVLDIGCGWGGLARYMADHYGVKVTGITVSKEQAALAQSSCTELPVTIVIQDYRDLEGSFDRVVSVGMFEHVGYKNYATFMDIVHHHLADDGIFLLHTIGSNLSHASGDPWIDKYIFRNGMLPSMQQITREAEGKFIIEDWHNFGADYDKTLMAWYQNFINAWPTLQNVYDERFYRMWSYYLLSCAGLFRARKAQLWQIVMTKTGMKDGYVSIRS